MAMAIGVFRRPRSVALALMGIRKFGVSEYNTALLSNGHVSGYLEQDARRGEIRTIEEGVYLALSREGVDREDMVMWLSALDKGNGVLVVRCRKDQAPWLAEAMRRAGALFALDSETQAETASFSTPKWAEAAKVR